MSGDNDTGADADSGGRVARAIRILVTDRDHNVREHLAAVIDGQSDMEVVATAASALQTESSAARTKPDVAIVDPYLDGGVAVLDLCHQLLAVSPATRCVLHTATTDERWKMSNDVGAILPKQLDHEQFLAAIRQLTS